MVNKVKLNFGHLSSAIYLSKNKSNKQEKKRNALLVMASFAKKKKPSFFRISFRKALKKTNHIPPFVITRSIYISGCSKSQLLT